ETCNGVDDNCDGHVDEGCPCIEGAQQACAAGSIDTVGVGECRPGLQTCKAGAWGDCEGAVVPTAEACDGKDNDCNGIIDDGLGTVVCGVGACRVVVPGCKGGATPTCTPGAPTPEVCNGVDDDCNGVIDDGLGTVSCGMGPCAITVPACAGGQ